MSVASILPHSLRLLKNVKRTIQPNGMDVMEKKYLIRDPITNNIIETPDQLFRRVAARIATIDHTVYKESIESATNFANELYTAMSDQRILPGGRNLIASHVTPNCVVMKYEKDTIENFESLRVQTRIGQLTGSGLGYPGHKFKPTLDKFDGHKDVYSPGPIGRLLQLHSDNMNFIQQSRNGANMFTMRVDHPDILEFIDCKKIEGSIETFNVSVMFTDEFIERAKNPNHPQYNESWKCQFEGKEYPLRNIIRSTHRFQPIEIKEVSMTANQIMKKIIKNSYQNGEPGCIFYDTMNKDNPIPDLGSIEATNPCGEQGMHGLHSCLLLAINWSRYWSKKLERINFNLLEHDVRLLVHAGDNTVDLFEIDIPELISESKKARRLGIGPMGVHDLFIEMEIEYGKEKSIEIIRTMAKFIQQTAINESEKLAVKRGEFEYWPLSSFAKQGLPKRRNATLLNAMPTGSIAYIFSASSGIEPLFRLCYKANVIGKQLNVVNQSLMDKIDSLNLPANIKEKVHNRIISEGTIQNIDEIPDKIKRIYKTANDISAEEHLQVQAAIQEFSCNAISKTINVPNSATEDDIEQIFYRGHELGCKGLTIYRDGSRDRQVLETTTSAESKKTTKKQRTLNGTHISDDSISSSVTYTHKKRSTQILKKRNDICELCASELLFEEGCERCSNIECGWSACSL